MARFARLVLVPVLLGLALPAFAEDPAPAVPAKQPAAPAIKLADDATATAAVVVFKEAWKAKGLKGEEKLAQRDWALSELVKVQHPLVVAELGDVSRNGDETLRTLAVIYLGDQKALPAVAGEQVLAALKKNAGDTVLVLSALQSLAALKYLGAGQALKDLMHGEDFVVKKAAITTVGQVGDMRLLDELLKLLGVDPKSAPPTTGEEDKKGGKEVVEEGYSYEGAEVTVDHGDADNTKENAEAKAKGEAQIAANKAAAQGGKGGGGGGPSSGGEGGSGGGRGGSARSADELKPYVLKALKLLTGETFMSSKEIRGWLGANGGKIEVAKQEATAAEAEQKKAAAKK